MADQERFDFYVVFTVILSLAFVFINLWSL